MKTQSMRLALAAGAVSVAVAGGFAMAGPPVPTYPPEPVTTNTPPGTQNNFDETYNVCRGTDPRCYHPWFDPNRPNKILLYTRTSGPRHANLGPALAAGLNPPLTSANVVHNAIISWMGAVGVAVDYTEDAEAFGSALAGLGTPANSTYKAVVFISTNRDAMWKHGTAIDPTQAKNTSTNAFLDHAKMSLREFMRAGGGFVGIHNAFGTESNPIGLITKDSSETPTITLTARFRAVLRSSLPAIPRLIACRPVGTSGTSGTTCYPFPPT